MFALFIKVFGISDVLRIRVDVGYSNLFHLARSQF